MSNNNSKSESLKVYLKLKQQECIIEKSLETFIENSKVYPEQWREILLEIDRVECEYKKIADGFRRKIIDIFKELKSVKVLIKDENVEKIDIDDFKNKLQALWKRIQDFKEHCKRTDKLIEEQGSLEGDLNSLMRIIQKYKNLTTDDSYYLRTANIMAQLQKPKSTKDLLDYDDVEDFSALVAKTGHTGNWSQEDHLLYLKLRKKHKNLPSLVRAILDKCPDFTKEAVINHDSWYKTYLELRFRQKAAVQEWRARKESMRLAKIAPAEQDGPRADDAPPAAKKIVAIETDDPRELKKIEEEKKKEMVRLWREQKQNEKAAEEERLRNLERAKLEDKENRRRKRDAELKKKLQEHKEIKNSKEEEIARETFKSNSNSSLLMQYFREKDQKYIEKRKGIFNPKTNESSKKVTRNNLIKSYESLFKDDEHEETTGVWQDEEPQKIEDKVDDFPISLMRDYPRRAAVTWQSFYELPEPIFF